MDKRVSRLVATIIVVICASALFADDRDENIDVYLVLDKSLSMVEEIDAVKSYVGESIVDRLLIPGDNLFVIAFYGKAETVISRRVTGEKDELFKSIEAIQADGRFTDIGNALDELRTAIERNERDERRRYLLLITDGKQEAPPESKYYSEDGSFNHAFLQNTKDILMEGWKVHILGIGASTVAEEIANQMAGTYSEVPEEPTKEELEETGKDLLGVIERRGEVKVKPVDGDGGSTVSFEIESSGYENTRTITINNVAVEIEDGQRRIVREEPVKVTIEPAATKTVKFDVQIPNPPDPGRYSSRMFFSHTGDTVITPAAADVEIRVRGFIGNNLAWLIPAAVALLGALAFLGTKLLSGGGSTSFTCEIEDGPVRKRQYKLKHGQSLFIIDGVMGLNILPSAGGAPAAELTADKDGLHLTVRDEKQFSVDSVPKNILGRELQVRKKNGKKARLHFSDA